MRAVTRQEPRVASLPIGEVGVPNRYLPFKRALDILLSVVLTILFAPLMLAIALGILLASPGPVLYRQMRVGKDGVPFRMLKFRSMQIQNDPDLHRQYVQKLIKDNTQPRGIGKANLKMSADPRVTGIGKYLRRFGLDELPQFFNVLKGEMSIVGPRPPLPYEYEVYADWHKQRMTALPGITGTWQVLAHNTVAFDEMVKIDVQYVQNMNLWTDLKIMVLTPVEMILGKGGG
jgi:lipopolysaccharide/colanic/teichoic acid biosynthesis glycosyltransferase